MHGTNRESLRQLCCRSGISCGGSSWNLFGGIEGCFRLSWFVDCNLLPLWVYLSYFLPLQTRHRRKHHMYVNFLYLTAFAQQLHISGPTLGQAVQDASITVPTSLSRTASGRGKVTGMFNFWVVTEGRVNGSGGK